MKKSVVLMLALGSITSAFAGISAKSRMEIEARSQSYFLSVANRAHSGFVDVDPTCSTPKIQDCIVFVAGSFPSADQRVESAKACIGNYGADCAKWAAGSFPSYEQRLAAAKGCRNNRTSACAIFVAGSFPSPEQRLTAVHACANADLDCVKYVAGSFPSYEQRVAAAQSCSNPN